MELETVLKKNKVISEFMKNPTKPKAIRVLRRLKRNGVRIYFSELADADPKFEGGRVVFNPRDLTGPRFAKEITRVLEVKNKDDWERVKWKYNL